LEHVDLVVLNDTTALFSGNPLAGLVAGGAVFMQSPYTDPADVWQRIPEHHKRTIRDKRIRVFFADMVKIARQVASEADLEMRMQGIVLLGAFLKLTPYAKESEMSDDEVYAGVEKALRKYFGKRGDRVVQDNLDCVKRGYGEMQEIPVSIMNSQTAHA
ncbi:MAG TPA: 2-oxoacid:acceptor oxidoreductase family protein, partial [Pirellulales bacterium]|nr:2-oxoacid:acceptor oxidoreductase family protein [Pirellulales bacterium]